MPKKHKIYGLNVNVTSHLFATVHILNETVWQNFPSIRQEPVNSPYHAGESTFVMQYDASEIWSFHSSNYKGYSFLDVMPYGLKVIKCIPPKHWYLFTRPHGITSRSQYSCLHDIGTYIQYHMTPFCSLASIACTFAPNRTCLAPTPNAVHISCCLSTKVWNVVSQYGA